jgi:hypothetical protein
MMYQGLVLIMTARRISPFSQITGRLGRAPKFLLKKVEPGGPDPAYISYKESLSSGD